MICEITDDVSIETIDDSSTNELSNSPSFNTGYELGRAIAPFLCLFFIVAVIAVLVLIIVRAQKKKRLKEQQEFDIHNE